MQLKTEPVIHRAPVRNRACDPQSVPIRNVGWKLLRIEKTKTKGVSMV